MGSFITNLHVAAAGAAEETASRIEAAVRAEAESAGLVVAGADDESDREVTIAWTPGARWVSVFDEAMEQDEKAVARLARAVAGGKGALAVSFLVHDSDVAVATLYRTGRRVGRLTSREHGDDAIAAWSLLLDEKRRSELAAAWATPQVFADFLVTATAKVIELDDTFALASGQSELVDVDDLQVRTLRLCARDRDRRFVAGPPSFAPRSGPQPAGWQEMPPAAKIFYVGTTESASMPFASTGGRGKGVRVEISGSALEAGLIELIQAHIVWRQPGFKDSPNSIDNGVRSHHEKLAGHGPGLLTFTANDAAIWPAAGPEGWEPVPPMEAMMYPLRAKVQANLKFKVLGAGKGDLRVTFTPLASPSGSGTRSLTLSVAAPEWRPILSAPDPPPTRLHALNHAGFPFALLCGLQEGDWREPVIRCLSRWVSEVLSHYTDRLYALPSNGRFHGDPSRRRGAWATLWDDLAQSAGFDAYLQTKQQRRDGGFRFQLGRAAPGARVNPFSVVLWLEGAGLPREELERARQALDSIVAEFMSHDVALQSSIGDEGSRPIEAYTDYERVCLGPPDHRNPWPQHDWRHHLRAVTPLLWLGPELYAAVAENPSLREVADVSSLAGGGARIALRDQRSLADLERALLPILPRRASETPD